MAADTTEEANNEYERMVNPLAFPDLDSGVKTEHKLCEASPGEDKSEEDESSHVPVLPTAAQLRDAAVSQLATFCESTGTAQMRLKYEEDISAITKELDAIREEAKRDKLSLEDKRTKLSKVAAKGIDKKLHSIEEQLQAKLDRIMEENEKCRLLRIEEFKRGAAEWKKQAVEVEKKLEMRNAQKAWKGSDADNTSDYKLYGPFDMPRKKADVSNWLQRPPLVASTPYKGAALFLVCALRRALRLGGMNKDDNSELLKTVLHKDCIITLNDGTVKIKKFSMQALQDIKGNIAKSYFVGATPDSNYDIDTTDLKIEFHPTLTGPYKSEEGNDCEVHVVCNGTFEGFPRTRVVTMR